MVNYEELKDQIEIEYRKVIYEKVDANRFCELISKYIRKTIENTIMLGNYID